MTPPFVALAGLLLAGLVARIRRDIALLRCRQRLGSGSGPQSASTGRQAWLAVPSRVGGALFDAGLDERASQLWTAWVVATAASLPLGLWLLPPQLVPALVGVVGVGPYVSLRTLRDRRRRLVDVALPDALEAIARSLRSGASLRQAIGEAGEHVADPLSHDLRSIAARADRGMLVADAVQVWVERDPSSVRRLAAAALTMAAELGGRGALAVDRVARSLRARQAVRRELHALSSQARFSALVIVLAPAAFGLAGLAVDGATAAFLLSTPVGWACLAGGALLDGAGACWMGRIVRGVQT